MSCFQPEIMIVDGPDQNRSHTGAVAGDGIGIDLVTYQGSLLRGNLKLLQALPDAPGTGLPGPGDAVQIVVLTESRNTAAAGIGNHAQQHIGLQHIAQPIFHLFRGNVGGIGHDGVVEIHHQQADIPATEQLRRQIRQLIGDQLG